MYPKFCDVKARRFRCLQHDGRFPREKCVVDNILRCVKFVMRYDCPLVSINHPVHINTHKYSRPLYVEPERSAHCTASWIVWCGAVTTIVMDNNIVPLYSVVIWYSGQKRQDEIVPSPRDCKPNITDRSSLIGMLFPYRYHFRVYFKHGVQPKCGVQDENCVVQNSICIGPTSRNSLFWALTHLIQYSLLSSSF